MKKNSKAPRRAVPQSPTTGFKTRQDFQSTTYILNNKNHNPSLEGKNYPATYTLPAVDEVYLEWEDENGETISGNKLIRYIPGEPSIFVDEQSEAANNPNRRGEITFVNGMLVVQPTQKNLKTFLDYCNWNQKNFKTMMAGKSTIFYEVNAVKEAEEEIKDYEVKHKLRSIVFEMDEEELRGLSMTFHIYGYDSRSATELRKEILDFVDYNPVKFEEELNSEERKRKYWVMKALNEGNLVFNEEESAMYTVVGGKKHICNVPAYADKVDFVVELSLKKDSVNEIIKGIISFMREDIPVSKKEVKNEDDFPLFNAASEYGIITRKGPWLKMANHDSHLGKSSKEAISLIKKDQKLKEKLEAAVKSYEETVLVKD